MKSIVKNFVIVFIGVILIGLIVYHVPINNLCSIDKLVLSDSDLPPGWSMDIQSESTNSTNQISEAGISTTYINNDSKVIVQNVDKFVNPGRAQINISKQLRMFDLHNNYYKQTTEGVFSKNLDSIKIMCINNDDFYNIKHCHTYLREKNIVVTLGSWIENNILTYEEYEMIIKTLENRMIECAE